LQTVFQFLDRCDFLHFRVRRDGAITRQGDVPGVDPGDDLTVRAARLLQETCGISLGAAVHIDKRLPAGGGLGGGSSDAATTLVALNHYWRAGMSVDELARLGLKLGADVPVFVQGHAAWGEGVGEQLTPIDLDEPWFVVVTPPRPVATGEIFADPQLTRNSEPITIADFVAGKGGNDCEPVVYRRYPEIAAAANWLSLHGEARLTGTGGCVFAYFRDKTAAEGVLEQLPDGFGGFVARGVNRSPLYQRLRSEIMST
jgi:4-diphosphocytidyl-2-C-methyl-D-erythritol kinase